MLSTVASATNWKRMSRRFAPMAFRMPISRVRSVTDTSMIFMIPMPPTSRDMPAIMPKKTTRVFVVSSRVSMVLCWLMTVKSSLLGDAVAKTQHSARFLYALVDVLHVPDLDVNEVDCVTSPVGVRSPLSL